MPKTKKDKHFPTWFLDNPLRRLFGNSKAFNENVRKDQVVADLGSGPGFYTFPLAEAVGPNGYVYAVDSDDKEVQRVKRKAEQKNYPNVEAHATSVGSLEFIKSDSVDFVLANGLLC